MKSFDENLELIESMGIPWKTVLDAIVENFKLLASDAKSNNQSIEDISKMTKIYGESSANDHSSPEVIMARGEYENLKARLDSFKKELDYLQEEYKMQKPVLKTMTRIEYVAYSRVIENDNTRFPHESYTKTQGANGRNIIEFQKEYINDIETGRTFNERIVKQIPPRNEVFVQGTKEVIKDPIRYVRFSNRKTGTHESYFVELVIKAGETRLGNASNTYIRDNSVNKDSRVLFDNKMGYEFDINSGIEFPGYIVDLGSGRKDLTEISAYPYPNLNYDFLDIAVSNDGIKWRKIVAQNGYTSGAEGSSVSVKGDNIYIENLETYNTNITMVKASQGVFEAEIGDLVTRNRRFITLYWDSDRALAKDTRQAGSWDNVASSEAKVINKITRNGVTVYALAAWNQWQNRWDGVGWIRGEDNKK